jgi:DNA-binding transcriptional ArsR family regulator
MNTLRAIHAAAREIGLEADDRRALQLSVTGKASLAEMTEPERARVLEALKARGWTPRAPKRRAAAPRADLRYVHVLWRLLSQAGAVTRGGRAGLNAFVRSRFGASWQSVPVDIDALRDARQIDDVVQALRAMCARAGIEDRQ